MPLLGVAENTTMTIVDRLAGRIGWLRPQARTKAAGPLTRRLSVVSAGLAQPVGELSGGNQQKVTVARALVRQPRLIVALTPTRGVDVAAKTLLLDELAEVTTESGASLLLATDELSDLVICDRVIVLVRGERFAEFTGPPFDREALIAATEGLAAWSDGRAGQRSERQGGFMSEVGESAAGSGPAARGRAEVEAVIQGRSRQARAFSLLQEAALLPVIILLVVVGTFVNSAFLTVPNFTGIGQQVSALGVIVVGESLILLIGGMDLSLEGTYGLAPMIAAWLIVPKAEYGAGTLFSPYLALLIMLLAGAFIGLVNGLLIVKGRLNGFIVTLGMTIVLAGLQLGIVSGNSVFNPPAAFTYLGAATVGTVPVSLIVTVAIFVITGLFLRYHRTGRAIYAVGGNLAAARAAGIKVDRIRIGVYVAGSVLAAVGGLMEAGRVSAVTGQQGYQEGIIFTVFAAAVIGGVSLRGGRGNMVGAASGVILLGLVQNIMDLSQVSNYWIEAVTGGVILVALVLARVIGGEATAE